MTDGDGIRYLVLFKLGRSEAAYLAQVLPPLQAALQRLATGPVELAVRSTDAETFAYFVRSRLNPHQIRAALEAPRGADPFLDNSDALMILELGTAFDAGIGFTRALTWLQRH